VVRGEARGSGGALRVGGLVLPGSVQRADGSLEVRFVLSDNAHTVPVVFSGVLPDLFVDGKGAIAQGRLDAQGTLQATEVLAKHDENYMPPEVHDALKQGGTPGGNRP
jgi:cytochrome c-type biogenesis protein CcmE